MTQRSKRQTAEARAYNRVSKHKTIRISESAYKYIDALVKDSRFDGRGFVGVVDYLLFGKFTTAGSGRPSLKKTK